jgi:oxaloacetate decarboxylase beta subunit
VTDRLAQTARTSFVDIVTILIGICVGCSASAETFLTAQSLKIFALGAFSFMIATASGVLFGKLMNRLSREPLNPLIGAAGVSAVPDSARVVQMVGNEEDPTNFLLMHAMGPNVAGVIGSAIAAGVLWSVLA